MKKYILLVIAVITTGIPVVAQATIITQTFFGTIINSARSGEIVTGDFTFDTTRFVERSEGLTMGITEGLSFSFSFDGQGFDETNSSFPPGLLFIGFGSNTSEVDGDPVELVYVLTQGINGVDFTDSKLIKLDILGFVSPFGPLSTSFDREVEIEATYVPIPGAFWLLCSGVAGLFFQKKQNYAE